MIDEQIRVEFLSPERWNHLNEVIERLRPPRRILYALEGLQHCAAYAPDGQKIALAPWYLADGSLDGDGLLTAHPEIDELQLWRTAEVEAWYARVNRACTAQTGIEAYLQTLRAVPCRRFVRRGQPACQPSWHALLPPPKQDCVQLKLIFREALLYFDALLLWQDRRLTLLSSLDRYPAGVCDLPRNAWDFAAVCDMIKAEFNMPVALDMLDWNMLR